MQLDINTLVRSVYGNKVEHSLCWTVNVSGDANILELFYAIHYACFVCVGTFRMSHVTPVSGKG